MGQVILHFPNLYKLELISLICLTHFCDDTIEGIEFPQLQILDFSKLHHFKNFWPTPSRQEMVQGNSTSHSSPLFNEKVLCPNLEILQLRCVGITALCSNKPANDYFSKLQELEVNWCQNLKSFISLSVARGLVNLRRLTIYNCPTIEEVIYGEYLVEAETMKSLFPQLELLHLGLLPRLEHFILTEHVLGFPSLRSVRIEECSKMKSSFLDQLVSCPNLGELLLGKLDKDTSLFARELPTDVFYKLETLKLVQWKKLKNLMSPSVARCFLNLRILWIRFCSSIEEVITKEELDKEMTIESLFPRLEEMTLEDLPKLKHFCLTELAVEFPFLSEVSIQNCPEMKTFVLGSVSTPRLKTVSTNVDVEVKDDLNKIIQQIFKSKKHEANDGQ